MFMDGGMDEEDMVPIYSRTLLSLEKEWNNAFAATRLDLENIILNEVNQTEKDKYHMISLLCDFKKYANE